MTATVTNSTFPNKHATKAPSPSNELSPARKVLVWAVSIFKGALIVGATLYWTITPALQAVARVF